MDLVSINIQRGRDHGLPGYIEFAKFCNKTLKADNFVSLVPLIPEETVDLLKKVYKYRHVEDIDLFIGGISESAVEGSILGPTFRCILGEQFKRLQHGDR